MAETNSHIPSEVYIGFLDKTIPIHWNYHAILMVGVWAILVPLCITIIRYGKPKPTLYGVRTKISIRNREWWWFNCHKYGLYTAVFLAVGGAAVAIAVSKGVSGSVHSIFGIITIAFGVMQVISGLLRGTHGGKYYYTGDPNDPSTWHGDHYDRTLRRRVFEAYHKTSGYFAVIAAGAAIGSGLMQFPMPVLAAIAIAMPFVFLAAWIVLEFLERRYDGYRAVHGYGLEHPYNKEREFL